MTKELVIDIEANATVNALYFDEFPLTFLGRMQVTRVTEIKYDEEREHWVIVPPGNEVGDSKIDIHGFASYAEARDFEIDWVQECKKQHLPHYFTKQGYKVALQMLEARAKGADL